MIRNAVKFMWILGVAHAGLTCIHQHDVLFTATASGQSVVRDSFDDDVPGTMWRVLADDASNCRLREISARLELRATGLTTDTWAAYMGNGWWLDPTVDFAMKVNFHYDLLSMAGGSICLGVTPDSADPWQRNVAIGVGCANRFPHYWHRRQTGAMVNMSSYERTWTDGFLCISYSARTDELYVSLSGYGADSAWTTYAGLLQDEWQGRPVYVWLGGSSDQLVVDAGRVYLDELRVERGGIPQVVLTDVYRFWSQRTEKQFFTLSQSERDKLVTQYPDAWTYQGIAYRAFRDDADPLAVPVYRFWSHAFGTHFFTVSQKERDKLIQDYPHVWTYEGTAFYVYAQDKASTRVQAVYRFWSPVKRAHFYTISETERQKMLSEFNWIYEGIVWYANL